ncbi:MAG: hypothetical protein Q4Q55_02245 [Methanobrevibacter sp.]|nr:hypothetical protein [Methanobrevibacter sp.]
MILPQKYYFSNALLLFVYISLLIIISIVIKMLSNKDTSLKADLRKKSSIRDEILYSNYDIQSCMVMLLVVTALLLSVLSVAAATPSLI